MNTWVRCNEINWEDTDRVLPSCIETLALPGLKDRSRRGIIRAISKQLRTQYGVRGICEDFKVYSDKEGERYDVLLLLGCIC